MTKLNSEEFMSIFDLDDSDLRVVLCAVPNDVLLMALSVSEPAVVELVKAAISDRGMRLLQEDLDCYAGATFVEGVSAQLKIVEIIKEVMRQKSEDSVTEKSKGRWRILQNLCSEIAVKVVESGQLLDYPSLVNLKNFVFEQMAKENNDKNDFDVAVTIMRQILRTASSDMGAHEDIRFISKNILLGLESVVASKKVAA